MGIQSQAMCFPLLEMQQVSVCGVARKIWSFLEKYFLERRKKRRRKQNFPMEMCTGRNAGVSHAGVHVKRNISPGSHERKGERGGYGVPDPRSRGKKAEAGDRKTLIHAPCTRVICLLSTFKSNSSSSQKPQINTFLVQSEIRVIGTLGAPPISETTLNPY